MRSRTWLTWLVFGVSAALVVEVLAWAGWRMLALERSWQREQVVRRALWRMDSTVTPIIAAEAARPYFQYKASYPVSRPYEKMFGEPKPGEPVQVSPLLEGALTDELVNLNFQIDPNGGITSPQVPNDPAVLGRISAGWAREQLATDRFAELRTILGTPAKRSETRLGEPIAAPTEEAPGEKEKIDAEFQARLLVAEQAQRRIAKQAVPLAESDDADRLALADAAAENEVSTRADEGAEAQELGALREGEAGLAAGPQAPSRGVGVTGGATAVSVSPAVEVTRFAPEWRDDPDGQPQLLLLRRVTIDGETYEQGIWLNWPELRLRLLDNVADLLPDATLDPVRSPAPGSGATMLATIPVRLDPGPSLATASGFLGTPARLTLALTAAAVVAATVAIALVLRASIAQGERRGRFVTAVTHELRTPLTTFRLYSQMLADGMVRDEDKRRGYLETLRDESARLARIVENVLDYARLGRAPRLHAEPIDADALLDRIEPALRTRAEAADFELVVERTAPLGLALPAPPDAVERILLNLVENACKYASEADDRRIHLSAERRSERLELTVRDHGPGIPAPERRRVFKAFRRGRRDRAGPNPGLGLGLALSRGLARQLGGDLDVVRRAEPGAALRLSLPSR